MHAHLLTLSFNDWLHLLWVACILTSIFKLVLLLLLPLPLALPDRLIHPSLLAGRFWLLASSCFHCSPLATRCLCPASAFCSFRWLPCSPAWLPLLRS